MKRHVVLWGLMALLIAIQWNCLNETAAQSTEAGIAVNGQSTNRAMADVLRLSITLEAKAADVSTTIGLLNEKVKQATIRLEKLGVEADSIVVGKIGSSASGDSGAMMARFKRMLGDDARLDRVAKVKPPVVLELNLTGDWKLDPDTPPNDLLRRIDEIKTGAVDADIACKDVKNLLSEEQEEVAEEMQAMMSEYGRNDTVQTGVVSFKYIRTISVADQKATLQSAYDDALKNAKGLADLVGRKMGKATAISTSQTIANRTYYDPYGRSSESETGSKSLADGTIEISSANSLDVNYSAKIAVVFEWAN